MERLQKLIAQAGLASRRRAEDLITAGRVKVDGRVVTELGTKADPKRSKIEVDGKRLVAEKPVYVVLHKPREVVSTVRDPEGRTTVRSLVRGVAARLVPVGRLDYHTSGVLLMTNDGDFAHGLLHPSKPVPKVYIAKVQGVVLDDDLEAWRQPVTVDGQRLKAADVRRVRVDDGKTWLQITLEEGKNRQIHRMGEALGFRVMRLARLEFAGITSEGLEPGRHRFLKKDELVQLKRKYGVPRSVAAASTAGSPAGAKELPPTSASTQRRLNPKTRSGSTRRGPAQKPTSRKAKTASSKQGRRRRS